MTPQEHIRAIYGFDFPDDFFLFYEFAERLNNHPNLEGKHDKGLGLLGMYLSSPFNVFKENFDPTTKDIIEDARHQADPPEFFTIIGGNIDGLHWGYYVDIPSENPPNIWVASYYSRDAFSIRCQNRTLFQEARERLESYYEESLDNQKTDKKYLAYYKEQVKKLALIRTILMEYETAERPEIGADYQSRWSYYTKGHFPKRVTIADTRCGMGVVAKNRLYRPFKEAYHFTIWNYYPDLKTVETYQTMAMKAIEEGFPATALEIGKNLWVYSVYNKIIHQIMNEAYKALNRPILQRILQRYSMRKSIFDVPEFQAALKAPETYTRLSLTWKKIGVIPKEIEQFKNLKHLNLGSNELETLPEEFNQLIQLENLDLNDNNFIQFPTAICQLSQLKTLRISNNGISKFPDTFAMLTSLEVLIMSNYKLTVFPTEICSLPYLKQLTIAYSHIKAIPKALNNLKNLEELTLYSSSAIENFPTTLANLTQLKVLKLRCPTPNNQAFFPKAFCELAQLEILEISSFIQFPDELSNLQNLKKISINSYQIEHIPKGIFKIKGLQKLSISCAKLNHIPDEIIQLEALEELYLYGNKIDTIPSSLNQLKQLKKVNLSRNNLSDEVQEAWRKKMPMVQWNL